jgi:iron complex outermembrane recepter protein
MPGNYLDPRGYSTAFPNCPADRLLDGVCQNYYWKDSILHPSVQTKSFLGNFTHELSDDTQIFGRLIVSEKDAKYNWGPVQPKKNFKISKVAAQNLVKDLVINGVDYSKIFDQHSNTRDVTLQFAVEEAGPQVREGNATLLGLGLGAKGIVFSDYDWEIYLAGDTSKQRDEQTDGAIKKSVVEAQMTAGTYNPFKEAGQRGALVDAEIRPWFQVESKSREVGGRVSGVLFDLPAGSVQGVLGAIVTGENFNAKRDEALKVLEPNWDAYDGADFTGFDGTGRRQVRSLYAELGVPVIDNFELQLAARWDQYSDFGNTVNPKAAFRYTPFERLYLRGSIGTGFRAPTLDELHRDEYPQYVSFTDAKTGKSTQMYIKGGGNEDLVAEKSRSYSVGLGVQATRRLSLMADYWNVNLVDPISFSQMAALTQAEANGYDIRKFATIERDPVTNEIIDVVAPYQNLGRKELSGYDLGLNYRRKTWGGHINARSNHSVSLIFKEKDWPLAQLENKVGRGRFPRWRNRSSIGWSDKIYTASASASTTAAQNNEANPDFRVAYYTEYSTFFKYRAPWQADLSLGIINVDNRIPPRNKRASDINERLYSPYGRRFAFEYTQNF